MGHGNALERPPSRAFYQLGFVQAVYSFGQCVIKTLTG
jgi:hypothetical protein